MIEYPHFKRNKSKKNSFTFFLNKIQTCLLNLNKYNKIDMNVKKMMILQDRKLIGIYILFVSTYKHWNCAKPPKISLIELDFSVNTIYHLIKNNDISKTYFIE